MGPLADLHPAPVRWLRSLAAVVLLAGLAGCSDDPGSAPDGDSGDPTTDVTEPVLAAAGALPELTPLRVRVTDGRPAIVDGSGREVLLRGATHTGLVAMPQVDPGHPPTRPPTEQDWDEMAARGFGVVRLAVSWAALEPIPGIFDEAYVEQIRAAVTSAASRRTYTVIVFHQDAWGPTVATPADATCPEGEQPALPGSGAPGWATHFDAATTCHPLGDPTASPAVRAAFTSLYENRDGVRDRLAGAWQRLVVALGDTAAIAGYDLFDEPLQVLEPERSEQALTDLYRSLIGAVRAGEAELGVGPRLAFVQPGTGFPAPGSMPGHPLALDGAIVLAPHIGDRAGGVGPAPSETLEALSEAATLRGWPLWVGEMGVASIEADARALGADLVGAQDDVLAGGAWWQWRRWCGDPAAIVIAGRVVEETQVQLNDVACPDDVDLGPNVELMRLAGRPYPRATPGALADIGVDLARGGVRVRGRIEDDLASSGDLLLWIPGTERPSVSGDGVGEVTAVQVVGGWYVSVGIIGSPYTVTAGP